MTLTLEQYRELVSKPCHYGCGNPLPETGAGLDRIDNSKGYEPGNVVPCCTECNLIRQDLLTVDEMGIVAAALRAFRRWCKNVV